jgi:hypothetical protein
MNQQFKASVAALTLVRSRVSLLILAVAFSAAALAAPPAGAGGEAGYGCSAGFDLGALTLNQGLALPRIQAGLTAGVFDTAGLTAGFNRVDRNGDRLLCFKDVGALNGSAANWVYTYNIVDNNASIPGS